jgi:hypothetical protein
MTDSSTRRCVSTGHDRERQLALGIRLPGETCSSEEAHLDAFARKEVHHALRRGLRKAQSGLIAYSLSGLK